jgi:hypothetical protein
LRGGKLRVINTTLKLWHDVGDTSVTKYQHILSGNECTMMYTSLVFFLFNAIVFTLMPEDFKWRVLLLNEVNILIAVKYFQVIWRWKKGVIENLSGRVEYNYLALGRVK